MNKDEQAGASSAVAAAAEEECAITNFAAVCIRHRHSQYTEDRHCCAAVRRTGEPSSLEASDGTKSHCGGLAWICLPVRWTLLKIALQGTL
ncbi:unnamed protein product [Sphagnum jensenii]